MGRRLHQSAGPQLLVPWASGTSLILPRREPPQVCDLPSPKNEPIGNTYPHSTLTASQVFSPILSYHNRNVPVLSTIKMSPGSGFTLPRKSWLRFFDKRLASRDDWQPEKACR